MTELLATPRAGPGRATVAAAVPLVVIAGAVAAGLVGGALLAVAFALGLVMAAGAGVLVHRRPWLAPWGVLVIFSTSAELRLRVSPSIGTAKDAYIALLVGALVAGLLLVSRSPLHRLRPLAGPLAGIGVLVGLYLLDPAGGHGSGWLFGSRLLLEALALLVLGLLCLHPERTLDHLVRAMTVVLPFEAAFAWIQQLIGPEALVFTWGYQYGAQVRVTSGGGTRTSGTFEDPFQLAALAVLGLALAWFVATRRQAVILTAAGFAVLAATSVRTAFIQAALLLVVLAVRRGWWRQAAALGAVAAVIGVAVLATTTTSVRPGAPEEPLLLTLNGRSSAWANAVQDPVSFVVGNGVGARGTGSTREVASAVSAPPAYDPTSAPPAAFAGDPAFLDSAYAQVQSDVGVVGSIALIGALLGFAVVLARWCRRGAGAGASWAALAVLLVSMVDWIGRSSLASYTTGFLTLYVLGVLIGTSSARADVR